VKKLFLLLLIALFYFPFFGKPLAQAADLCCPTGSTDAAWKCPLELLIEHPGQCCRKIGFSNYEYLDKIDCQSVVVSACSFDKSGQCETCTTEKNGIWTAIGCIPLSAKGIIGTFLPFSVGIAGGIAFLIILFGAIQMMTSAGNPEKLNAGKELIGAAIMGLLLIVFSIFFLRLIGVDILQIPGFS